MPRQAVAPQRPASATPTRRRVALARSGGFTGARSDLRSMAEWPVLDAGPNDDSLGDLPTLRARSQDLERNAPIAGAAFDRLITAIVGEGLEPKPRIDHEYLGITPEQAREHERVQRRLWWHWAGDNRCDIGRRNTFAELTSQALGSALSGGEVFTLFRDKERAGDLLGTKLQLLEAARVQQPAGRLEDATCRAGIEMDADGAVVAFHVLNRHPGEGFAFAPLTTTRYLAYDETGEPLMLQTYRQKRPGQLRGIPLLAPVIETLRQISKFTDNELMAAVISSAFTVFVKGGAAEGLAILDEDDPSPAPKNQYKLGNGAIIDLAEGEEIQIADPKRPNANFDPFFDAMCRQLGANIGVPYEVLVQRFEASYSASRASLLQFWATVRTWRSWLVNQWAAPVRARVIREAVARGILVCPGFFTDPLAREAWLACEWSGPQMPEIDRKKAIDAAAAAIAAELSTRDRESTALNGTDWESNHAQLVVESRAIRADGTGPAAAAPVAPAAAGTDPTDPTAVDPTGDTTDLEIPAHAP